ncbi:MAG: acyltransferase [Bacteroidota bacterium]
MRLRKIDFLRGVAIILVIFRHHPFIADKTLAAGWMGVDLFFVLSGFLVSGLLFNEYKRRDSINIGRFFVRRGFKIYPLFYVTMACVIILDYLNLNHWPLATEILSEIFFLQSYVPHLIPVTWSLAVEEHFYILLMFAMAWLVSVRQVRNQKLVYGGWAFVAIACLVMRIITRVGVPYEEQVHAFPTHLRIDSLLAGVMISYTLHFNCRSIHEVL